MRRRTRLLLLGLVAGLVALGPATVAHAGHSPASGARATPAQAQTDIPPHVSFGHYWT